jgi:tetratricopeptide (TPR) repeat protein
MYLTQAGDKVRDQFAHGDALRFYNQALEFASTDSDRFDLIEKRVAVLHISADRESEFAAIEELSELAEALNDDDRRIDALLACANYYLETEHLKALEPAQEAAEIARKTGDPVREARALHLSGSAYWFTGQYKPSREDLDVAARRFLEADMPGEAAGSLTMLSMALSEQGDNAAGMEKVKLALEISREAGNQLREGTSLRRLAIAHIKDLEYSQALPYAIDALELHQQLGDRSEEINALNVLGIIYMNLGESEKAEDHLRASLAMAEEFNDNTGIQFAIFNLSGNYVVNGQYEQGILHLNEQIDKYGESQDKWLVGGLYWNRVLSNYIIGNLERALHDNRKSREVLEDIEPPEQKVGKLCTDVHLYLESGDLEQARTSMLSAEELARDGDDLNQKAALAMARAVLYWIDGDSEQGLIAVDQAIDAYQSLSSPFMLAFSLNKKARYYLNLEKPQEALRVVDQIMLLLERPSIQFRPQEYWYSLFLAQRGMGRDDEARRALKKAYAFVKKVADSTRDEHLCSCWLNVPDNGRILAEAEKLGIAG